AGDLLGGEDHQRFNQRVRCRLRLAPGALDATLAVERELHLRALDAQRPAAEAATAQLFRDAVCERERLRERRLGRLLPSEDPLRLPVVQTRIGADRRAVEPRLPARSDLDRDAAPVADR